MLSATSLNRLPVCSAASSIRVLSTTACTSSLATIGLHSAAAAASAVQSRQSPAKISSAIHATPLKSMPNARSFATSSHATTPNSSFVASSLPPIPLFQRILSENRLPSTALTSAPNSTNVTYLQLLQQARVVQAKLQSLLGKSDLRNERIAFLYPSSFGYVATLYGIWLSGAIAVPLHQAHAPPEIEYLLSDSASSVLLYSSQLAPSLSKVKLPTSCESRAVQLDITDPTKFDPQQPPSTHSFAHGSAEEFSNRRALFIYTSGTTGKPKGVVWTHSMLNYQMSTLSKSWAWNSKDSILHALPLHHIHGLVNVLLCALYNGARVRFMNELKFTTDDIGRELMQANSTTPDKTLTLFMAVPTIYARLIIFVRNLSSEDRARFHASCAKFRLMVSGSAALPQPVMDDFERISGQLLLERYGMSETGMTLSQPLDVTRRTQSVMRGSVGIPLPDVQTKIVPAADDSHGNFAHKESQVNSNPSTPLVIREASQPLIGELRVKGPGVFSEYWNLPEKTQKEFDSDGWFCTGDIVSVTPEQPNHAISFQFQSPSNSKDESQRGGFIPCATPTSAGVPSTNAVYRILGRSSIDILKSGGYKISALEVERVLLSHPDIEDVAVVGVPHEQYGQVIAAALVLKPATPSCSSTDGIAKWSKAQLATYQIPRLWKVVKQLPKNAMGKTNKKELVVNFQKDV